MNIYIFLPMFSFEYTIDIEPSPATELGLKSVLYKKEEEEEGTAFMNGKTGRYPPNASNDNLPSIHQVELAIIR